MNTWLSEARTFAEALFSTEDGPPPSARLDWLMTDLADFVEQAGPRTAFILKSGLRVANWIAPPMIGKAPPLTKLSVADRCRALDRLEHSAMGLPLLAAKAILCICYYEHPDVLREAGVIQDPKADKPSCLIDPKAVVR